MEKATPSGKLINAMGGPHRVTGRPSFPKSVLVFALKVLYAGKSLSLKQTEVVGHHCPKTFPFSRSIITGEKLALCASEILLKQLCMCKSAQNFFSIGEGLVGLFGLRAFS